MILIIICVQMEKSNKFLNNSALYRLQYISFVSPSEKEHCNEKNVPTSFPSSNITGEEASQFYNEIISAPPSNCQNHSSCVTKKSKAKCSTNKQIFQNSRRTIFHYAQEGNIEGVKYLLSENCEVNQQDIYGWTALMCASYEGHYGVVECLLKSGADVLMKNQQGHTALDLATKNNHIALLKLLKNGSKKTQEKISCVEKYVEKKYCTTCNCSYNEPVTMHERSIAHLINCKRDDPSTFYHIPENNKGFQIMLKTGWDKNKGLGPNSEGRKFPVKTVFRKDRACIGSKKEVSQVTHFGSFDYNSVKKSHQPSLNLMKERTLKKKQREKLYRKMKQKEINFRREFL